mgnify:CR=1 FL=1
MFGERCTLCGGKLDSKKVCKECGLDNSKSEKNYRINQSSCDGMPLTHVHEEKKEKPKERKQVKQVKTGGQQPYRQMAKKKKGKKWTSFVAFIPMLFVGVSILGTLVDSFTDVFSPAYEETYEETYVERDPYENVEAALPAEGEAVTYFLENGFYTVGVHIAPGNYRAEALDDFDTVIVHDNENGIYLYEYKGKDETNYLDNLWLYPGARVEISGKNPVTFISRNADTEGLTAMANPVAGSYMFDQTQKVTAGKDIEPGVYDLRLQEGEGQFKLVIYDENGEEYRTETKYLYSEGQKVCKNLVIPENAVIMCETDDIMTYTLTASEVIGSTDYLGYYTEY